MIDQPDFRLALRDATRADHDRLDNAISQLDITTQSGFLTFCRIHRACFAAIAAQVDLASLPAMIAALDRDIQALGRTGTDVAPLLASPIHPLAADYLITGSIMGTKVMHRVWTTSNDLKVQSANAYFGLRQGPSHWADVCDCLRAIPAQSVEAATITADTKRLFTMFLDSYTAYDVPA